VKYLLAILILAASCAWSPEAARGITWIDVTAEDVTGAELAAACMYSMDLPDHPFAGVVVEYRPGDFTPFTFGDLVVIPEARRKDGRRIIAHELIHVALTRYRPKIADHHRHMGQAGLCLGGCKSMPPAFDKVGCE